MMNAYLCVSALCRVLEGCGRVFPLGARRSTAGAAACARAPAVELNDARDKVNTVGVLMIRRSSSLS